MRTLRALLLAGLSAFLLLAAPHTALATGGAVAPAPGPVQRVFDPPDQPWLAGHRGVDLLSQVGAPVRAALAGRVTFASQLAGRGVVVVSHGPIRTTYEPVTATVSVGQAVGTGAIIGTLQAGHSCAGGACLHWGLRRGEEYLDPMSLLDPPPLRLLPSSAFEQVALRPWRDWG
jgi:Membrane proteins related to metalloendopeptidases